MRQLFVDTETTGLDCNKGHRIIEFGAVEMVDRILTGNEIHFYFKPDIKIDQSSFKIHGISNEFLAEKPLFREKIDELIDYIKCSELIIHNAPFDLSFLNFELSLIAGDNWGKIQDYCTVVDSLVMARKKHPRKRNSLNALCERYGVNNSHRQLHGALRDAKLLANVYLMMTGGQIDLFKFPSKVDVIEKNTPERFIEKTKDTLIRLQNIPYDNIEHNKYLDMIEQKSNKISLWRKLSIIDN